MTTDKSKSVVYEDKGWRKGLSEWRADMMYALQTIPGLTAMPDERGENIHRKRSSSSTKGGKKAKIDPSLEEPKLLFNKFLFEDSRGASGQGSKREKKRSLLPKNPKQALQVIAKKKEQLSALRENDPQRAVAREEHSTWAKAISKAQGIAVRDDETKLRRAVKRQEKEKERKKKQWEIRKEQTLEAKGVKQAKRRENIQQRKEDKKGRKGKK